MKPRILINMPDPHKDNGGVASHFYGLGKFFPPGQVSYCYTGGQKNRSKLIATPLYLIQYLRFAIKLLFFRPHIVNLNPSLRLDAVVRDGIYLLIAKSFGKKVIVFWHGWKQDFEEKVDKKYLQKFKKVYGRADVFVTLSNEVNRKLRQWGFEQPIFSTTTKVDDFLLSGLDITSKCCKGNVLFLGRLEKTKGIFETLEVFKKLQADFPDTTLTIAGNGPDEQVLRDRVTSERIGNVRFLGYIKNGEKVDAFASADVFILPSYTEGMPTAVLEAMAFGLPVVTTPVGGIPDFFVEDRMGYLAPHTEVDRFAQKIKSLYSNPEEWKKISLFNHQYATDNFLASSVAAKMIELYKQLYHGTFKSNF